MPNTFDLEYQYQLYLKRVNLDENKMHHIQKQETKRAFMGACGQMLFLLRDELSQLTENEGVKTLKAMQKQVKTFFTNEILNQTSLN